MRSTRLRPVLGLSLVLALGSPAAVSTAAPAAAPSPVSTIIAAETDESADPDISVENVKAHLQKLQEIADANGGNRYTGQPGYQASVDYVKEKLETAGYSVDVQEFQTQAGTSYNVIAEVRGTDSDSVVMMGSHLDSVSDGPGINDNGTGSAGVLETALAYAESGQKPKNTVRFGFWGAEELGLLGSTHYVEDLSSDERNRIKAYVNFDMIASPNAGYLVYDDNSAGDWIRDDLVDWYTSKGVSADYTDPDGRSDHAAFRSQGIATGGIFSGAEGIMSEAEAQKWGGKAGEPYDPCYHSSCDNIENIDEKSLELNSDAIGHMVWSYGERNLDEDRPQSLQAPAA